MRPEQGTARRSVSVKAIGAAAALVLTLGTRLPGPAAGQAVQKELQELGRPLRYEVSVTLKLIQVSVLDKKGQPVRDLTKDDFLVFDNGRPVEITAFEKHSLGLGVGPGPTAPDAGAAPPSAGPAIGRKFFFFFDFAFNNPRGIGKAKEAALDFLNSRIGPHDEAAVLTYSQVKGLTVQEYLTKDHAKVRETIEAIDRKAASGRASEIEQSFWREAIEGPAPGQAGTTSRYSWERQEAKSIAQVFIERLTELAKALRYVQGRKDFLLFSSGVPGSMIYGAQAGSAAGGRNMFDAGDTVLRDRNETLLKEFAAADCAFYAFDTREAAKVASLFAYDEQTFAAGARNLFSTTGVFADYNSVFKDEQLTGRNTLQRLSRTTGGKYFGNIDTYDRSLDQLQDLTGTYYVLGFSVAEKEDGAFHEVRVEVGRKGLEVRSAGGYFNPKPFEDFNELERKLHLFDLALNERAFSRLPDRLPMKTVPVSLPGRSGLIVLGRVPPLLAAKLGDGPLEFVSLVLDKDDNIIDIRRAEAPADGPGATVFRSATEAGPGSYRCRLVVRNMRTGAAAVSSVPRTEIEAGAAGLKAQPVVLFTARREAVRRLTAPGGRASGPFVGTDLYPLGVDGLLPVLDAVRRDQELTVVIPCEVPWDAAADLLVNAQVIDAAGGGQVPVPFFLKARERQGLVEIIHLGIPAGSLPPGTYILYVYLQEPRSGTSAYGRLGLTVSAD